jgi:hypothetical protein
MAKLKKGGIEGNWQGCLSDKPMSQTAANHFHNDKQQGQQGDQHEDVLGTALINYKIYLMDEGK